MNNITTIILICIGGGLTLLGTVYMFFTPHITRAKALFVIGFLALGVGGLINAIPNGFSDKVIAATKTPDRSEYTVYLDGNEVEADKIDLSLYKVSYDDEKKIAYATQKTDDGTLGILTGFWMGHFAK